jgi:catalase
VNYEPNSWSGEASGPREDPKKGFHSYPEEIGGLKQRVRSESFSDHYSQARQFYMSQTGIEQCHIAGALIFELSKVKAPAIRSRVVAHLFNIDDGLARSVARGLRLKDLPKPADAARPARKDLAPSPALSILRNGPERFEGRKLGVLVTDGVAAEAVKDVREVFEGADAMVEIVAPEVGGVKASDGSWIEGDEKLDGAPSVLYDAVAVLVSAKGGEMLAKNPAAKDFVSDAFAHCKFIACTAEAKPLFEKAGLAGETDEGVFVLQGAEDARKFLSACGSLRYWDRGVKAGQPQASQAPEPPHQRKG